MGSSAAVGRSSTDGADASSGGLGREAFRDLQSWLGSDACQRLGLLSLEREMECRGQQVHRLLLQEHIDRRGMGDVGAALRVGSPDGGTLLCTRKRIHVRSLITLFGEVSIARMGYSCRGHRSLHPLDAELQLPARIYSYEVQRRVVKAAVQGPFDEAIGLLADLNGIAVPKRSAEQIVLDASVDFENFYAQRRGSVCEVEAAILVGAIDCKGIPMVKATQAEKTVRLGKGKKRQKKRMSTVAAVFCQTPEPRTPDQVVESLFATAERARGERRPRRNRPIDKRVWASLVAEKTAFITDVREEMLRRDPGRSHPWVIVTDGERALQRRVCVLFEDTTLVLDLFHVLEKLWKAAHALHPEGSEQAELFVRVRVLRILRGQVSQVVKGLRQMVTKRKLRGTNRKTLLDVAAYLYHNRARMGYDRYLANGWPIASGSVEGACKNLVKDRMERSGMRWTPPMAEAMLRMRAIYLSGDLQKYWNFHICEDQRRLYPHLWTVVQE
ncbi:MAG: ISKra4 family transposase [Gemmatimonas sp.]|nr:ISKra4 family transposase [Gemmatimonas sp.]